MSRKKTNTTEQTTLFGERVIQKPMEDCLHDSMIPYAEYVILDRALPRIEDGLKPVQRRILYTMMELSTTPDKPHRKSARIVGDCLGKYHPHGDTSIYEAMVRMAQDFVMRMPLVDGHGNFGSIDGDSAAAMRYTEARMAPLALELLRDIEKDTVKFELNFDDTLKEPVVLPGRFPNLIVNGSNGIAVGLATSIPPHNLLEAIDACIAVIDNPNITLDELMTIIPCPDFPTGGYILRSNEIKTAYSSGRGRITMRAKTHFEQTRGSKTLIVITELPYQVNKTVMLTKILNTSQKKRDTVRAFSYISDIRDESDRQGLRAVIELKKDADPHKVLAALYKHTDLQCNFNVNMVVIADGRPSQMGLIDILKGYIKHQQNVIERRTQYELDAAIKREHVLDGLMTALVNLDRVIELIRASKTPKQARDTLMSEFNLSEIQAQAILDLRLQRLTNLEAIAIERESKSIKKEIVRLKSILSSKAKLYSVIRNELLEIRNTYKDTEQRRTVLIDDTESTVSTAEDIEQKPVFDVVVDIYPDNLISRRNAGMAPPETDEAPIYSFNTKSDRSIKLFTNVGSCLTIDVSDVPELPKSRSKVKLSRLESLIHIERDEKIVAAFCDSDINESTEYILYTESGNVKRTLASEYVTRKSSIAAITLKNADSLVSVERVCSSSVLLITEQGMCIRFETNTVPCIGRTAAGVKCIKLNDGDRVIFASQVEDAGELLCISDRGYAKRSFMFDYDIQGRNGKGVKTFDFRKNGSNGSRLIKAFYVLEAFDIEATLAHGSTEIFNTDNVKIERRSSSGHVAVISVLDNYVVNARALKTTTN